MATTTTAPAPNVIASMREQTAKHHGKRCTVVRSVTPEDGEAFDRNVAKSVVKLEDGTQVYVVNDEIRG